jgi:non-heme chloroperoxidase
MNRSPNPAMLGRMALAITLMFVFCASSAAQSNAEYKPPECVDHSPHKVRFVTVAPGVDLEVLDWGGSGEAMVLLTGAGDNAHVYDEFALQFTDYFRVIGITRRGFARSSKPAGGYDPATRAHDIIAILDAFGISQAVFVGHSLAGDELSTLGSAYPNRVKKLVYLDAYDYYAVFHQLPDLPNTPYTEADGRSLDILQAATARLVGERRPNADVCDASVFSPSGKIVGSTTPDFVFGKIKDGITHPVNYRHIQASRLGIFVSYFINLRLPWYLYLTRADQAEFDKNWLPRVAWQQDAIQRFGSHGSNSIKPIVLTLPLPQPAEVEPTAYPGHYVYINNEAFVVQEMRKFLGRPFVEK